MSRQGDAKTRTRLRADSEETGRTLDDAADDFWQRTLREHTYRSDQAFMEHIAAAHSAAIEIPHERCPRLSELTRWLALWPTSEEDMRWE